MGLCEENHILIKKICMNSKVMERRDWWKNFRQNDGRRLLWTSFWNICKNNARLLGCVVAEDWELLVQQQTSETSTTYPGRRSPDASNIATACQKNRYPSFISCPYNVRWLAWNYVSSVWKKTTHTGAVRSKLYQPFAIKLTQAGTLFHQNS